MDGEAVPGGEGEPCGVVCVAGDLEGAVVMGIMVVGAEAGEVVGIGGSAVGPVDEVVGLEACGGGTAGVSAAAVAVVDEASGAGGDDTLGSADVDRGALGVPDELDGAFAGEFGGEVSG